MTNIFLTNSKPGKPAIHGSALASLPLTERLRWLAAIATGEATLLSLTLAQLPHAFNVSPTALREARRAGGVTIKPRRHKPTVSAATAGPGPIVDVIETFRKIGPDGFLKLAEMMERDGLARAAAAAKANGAALNGGGMPHHT
jgi:hypothetical protein